MFDIGFLELVLIAVLALLVLGPERLPHAARTAGKWVGKAKRMASNLTEEVDRQLKAEELRERIKDAGDDIKVEEVQKTIREALDRAEDFKHMVNKDISAEQLDIAPVTTPVQAAPSDAENTGKASTLKNS
ncbi:Sec-independent protein translocase protein TatB [Alkalimarinus alittae]|uniref:Sec-independent protein translocase protein TatB n=1 Tax=Alkalimarinus alittae TaxID=2961619 RepID=A0ABY6N418_9ALTE|nr:Sec-independent protein translocase protein TatB [Alkalimarinus alittae]UZE96759.1 Sec-independent protein translocase protein TatB [Alkalimarinus alittae]